MGRPGIKLLLNEAEAQAFQKIETAALCACGRQSPHKGMCVFLVAELKARRARGELTEREKRNRAKIEVRQLKRAKKTEATALAALADAVLAQPAKPPARRVRKSGVWASSGPRKPQEATERPVTSARALREMPTAANCFLAPLKSAREQASAIINEILAAYPESGIDR